MSQTETLLVLALGSALTFVFFLLFGRIFWNMAMAAGARRRAKDVPIEMLNIQAERDRLRAEHALMARKLELKLDDIKIRMAEQMAEVSRNRNRVQGLLDDINTRDEELKQRKREIDALTTQLQVKDAELASAQRAIKVMEDEAAEKAREMARLQQSLQKLTTTLRSKDALVGELNSELRGLLTQSPAAVPTGAEKQEEPGEPAESRLRRRVAELTSISAEMSRGDTASDPVVTANATPAAAEPDTTAAREAQIKEKLAEAERQTEEMQKELRALDEMLAKATGAEAPAAPKKQGAMANVVSLAQRIRALQQGMND